MKHSVGVVVLQNRTTEAFEQAEVFRDVDQKNIDDFDQLWKPMLKDRRDAFPSWEAAAEANAQDAHWDWGNKAQIAGRSLQWETFAIECDGQTQGLMLVDVTKFGRVDSQRGRELVYVELVATAPWNRPKFVETPMYKGVGRILITTAISLSVELGFKGRIGLHSILQAERWYRTETNFTDVGFDPAKNMQYFEMTEAQAASFISDK